MVKSYSDIIKKSNSTLHSESSSEQPSIYAPQFPCETYDVKKYDLKTCDVNDYNKWEYENFEHILNLKNIFIESLPEDVFTDDNSVEQDEFLFLFGKILYQTSNKSKKNGKRANESVNESVKANEDIEQLYYNYIVKRKNV
jgi:hypothetical protein